MRLWHYRLFPYLPDLQFRGQLRELVLIMRQWRDKGKTNHLLINRIMEYPKADLYSYLCMYEEEYERRYEKSLPKQRFDFALFCFLTVKTKNDIFEGWHNTEYLRVCMANLYEKHHFGIGKSRITDSEWQRLLNGYRAITGEEYRI